MADYSSYHTALEAAVNQELSRYEIRCDVVRKGYYVLRDGGVGQPHISVACSSGKDVVLTLLNPTKREDGTPLRPDEITGYEIRAVDIHGLKSIWAYKEISK